MYVEQLHLRNLRCFRDPPPIDLCHPDRPPENPEALPNVTLLLGDSGTGKTTILEALALAALAPVIQASGYVPYRLIRRGPEGAPEKATLGARLRLHAQDLPRQRAEKSLQIDLGATITRRQSYELFVPSSMRKNSDVLESMFDDRSLAMLVLGYGATRSAAAADPFEPSAQSRRRGLRYQRVAGLFEEHVALTPLSAWLPQLQHDNPERSSQVAWLLNELLDDRAFFTGDLEGGDYLFEFRGTCVPFVALPHSYRAYIGWLTDLLHHICMGCPSDKELSEHSGLVLVDEIDLHLHPSWQRTLVPTLSRTLPRLQFVFSTQSPLVAGSLYEENILVMEQAAEGAMIARRQRERIHGLDADQVLTSVYFGLPSSRAHAAERELRAIAMRAMDGEGDAALDFMRKLVGKSPEAARSPERSSTKKKSPKAAASKGRARR